MMEYKEKKISTLKEDKFIYGKEIQFLRNENKVLSEKSKGLEYAVNNLEHSLMECQNQMKAGFAQLRFDNMKEVPTTFQGQGTPIMVNPQPQGVEYHQHGQGLQQSLAGVQEVPQEGISGNSLSRSGGGYQEMVEGACPVTQPFMVGGDVTYEVGDCQGQAGMSGPEMQMSIEFERRGGIDLDQSVVTEVLEENESSESLLK